MTELEEYYNKFNEEKRFDSRHGQVEYRVSMKYIHKYLDEAAAGCAKPDTARGQIRILDIGAGTGRYSVALAKEGQVQSGYPEEEGKQCQGDAGKCPQSEEACK